jgi:outer membrane protein assembly factor BamB
MAHFRLAFLVLLTVQPLAIAQQQARPAEDSLDSTHLQENNQLGTRFRNAEARAAQGQWSEAIEEYQRILIEAGDELAPVDKRHVVQARWLAQARLSALPPQALTLYRSRIDPAAKKLLEQGRTSRDPAPLQRIVDETFCSSYTDQALDLLGDLAFERGDFDEAEQLWRMVVPPTSVPANAADAKPPVVDPKIDIAGIRAKQILAQLFRGEVSHVSAVIEAFAKTHPAAKGKLAGRQGVYAETLHALASRPGDLGSPLGPGSWNQFAGDAERNRVLPKAEGRLARLPCTDGPTWRQPLEATKPGQNPESHLPEKISSWSDAGRLLGYYPVISGDRVVVADSQMVTAYQLSTGQRVFHYKGELNRENLVSKPGVEADVAYPLTVVGDRIYARLGSKAAGPPRRQRWGRRGGFNMGDFQSPQSPPQTVLVCLTMQPHLGQEVWTKQPPAGDQGEVAVFEGAPIVHQGRVYIAMTRYPAGQTQTFVACYDADTGELRWQHKVCETAELKDGESRSRHHLLTLAGRNIVYCSHSGAIVALDAVSGHPRWGVRYASRGPKTSDGQPSFRSLAPCCYADGRIYAAPLDLDRLLCLDSRTGETLWESEPMEVVHMLGVSRGKIFLTALTPRRGIRALDAATGSSIGGWIQPGDDTDLPSAGRGLLAGEWVFWPSARGLKVLKQSNGEPVMEDEHIFGNLAAAEGCLVVADAKNLSVYLPEKWALRRRSQEAAQDGADSSTHYRLALSEADAGFPDRAMTTLERALELARDDGQRERARTKLHELLLDAARQEARSGAWTKVESTLRKAAEKRFSRAEQARCKALEGSLAEEAGKPVLAVAAWQSILETSNLRDALLSDGKNIDEPAGVIATEHLDRLLQRHGRAAFAASEARAERVARAGGAGPQTAERLAREFPHALATRHALEARALLAEKEKRPWEAADAHRRLLEFSDETQNRLVSRAALARAYEQQGCWEAARATLERLEREGGDRTEAAIHSTLSIREWTQERLRTLPCGAHLASGQSPFFSRRWQAVGDSSGSTLLSEDGTHLFRVAGARLDCLSTGTGKPVWERALPWSARWLGKNADLLVAAGESGLMCVRQGDGALSWKRECVPAKDEGLGGFQIASGRLYCMVGASRFGGWDVISGRCVWCDWAPGSRLGLDAPAGRFGPEALVTSTSCLLVTGLAKPLIFDSRSGSRLDRDLGAQIPVLPGGRVAAGRYGLLIGRESIQAVELARGELGWQFRFEAPNSLTGELPQVLERDGHLFIQIVYNYGYLLEQLDSKTGARQWPMPVFVGPRALDLARGSVDEATLYCSGPGGLEARRLTDGQLLWKNGAETNRSPCALQRVGSVLLSQPANQEIRGWAFSWLGVTLQVPSIGQRAHASPYCTVEVIDPSTGSCLQALNVAKSVAAKANWAFSVASLSPRPVVRALGVPAPHVLVTSENLLVAQGLAATAFDVKVAAASPSSPALGSH